MSEMKTFEMIFELEPECLCGDAGEVCLMVKNKTELVRCRDCKHYYNDADTGMACEFTSMSQPEDGFCNWAEKRADNEV